MIPYKKKKGKKGDRKIYIDALDNIIAVMKGRRIFDRIGFNLPMGKPREKQVKFLKQFKEWVYVEEFSDWLELDGALNLTGYVASNELRSILKDSILIKS